MEPPAEPGQTQTAGGVGAVMLRKLILSALYFSEKLEAQASRVGDLRDITNHRQGQRFPSGNDCTAEPGGQKS